MQKPLKAKSEQTGGAPLSAIVQPLLAWYDTYARRLPWRENRDPYRIWLSEIMLQQTRVETVRDYFIRFLAALPDLEALATAPEDELLRLWEGLGYYSRARNLQRAARIIVSELGGRFPETAEALEKLPGIGTYTAGAIASIAFDRPEPAVDGNVLRVISRLCNRSDDIAQPAVKRAVTGMLREIYPAAHAGTFTQSLMELGALVCLPNGAPNCANCPLAAFCAARAAGTQRELPVKAARRARRREELTVLVLRLPDGRVAVRKRPAKGLLAGLYELPNLPGATDRSELNARLHDWGVACDGLRPLPEAVHVFTHVEWRLHPYLVTVNIPAAEFLWTAEPILPTAFKKLLPAE